jgi:hypothetical protein
VEPLLPRPNLERREGDEPFRLEGGPLDLRLADFWRWAFSDVTTNTTRGILAEFIVGSALGIPLTLRDPWAEHDLVTPSGLRIEVKSSSYVQSWGQRRPSKIVFSIRDARSRDDTGGAYVEELGRHSDFYIFAVLAEQDRSRFDPLNLTQWQFFVLATRVLDERCRGKKAISLGVLKSLGAAESGYADLGATLKTEANGLSSSDS